MELQFDCTHAIVAYCNHVLEKRKHLLNPTIDPATVSTFSDRVRRKHTVLNSNLVFEGIVHVYWTQRL